MTNPEYLLFGLNVLIALAAFFGGLVIRGALSDLRKLEDAHLESIRDMGTYAKREEVKSDMNNMRSETQAALERIISAQAVGFDKIFSRLDDIRTEIGKKADRLEAR